jgi:predicted transcriptional regulator of viral defense system
MEKMNPLRRFDNQPFFTIESLKSHLKQNPVPTIKYNQKTGKIIRLKRGVYVYASYTEKLRYAGRYEDYLEFIANKLISPSYLSGEYMLSRYSILSESPSTLTSITQKTTRIIENEIGNFSYSNIKEQLFCGFLIEKKEEFTIFKATKAKALFDFLYLKKRILRVVNEEVIQEFRFNLDEFSKDDKEELSKYLDISQSLKLMKICKLLFR